MNYYTNIGLYVGRFQPLHIGHVQIIKEALKKENKLLIIIGSIGSVDKIKNPYNFEERKNLILNCLTEDEKEKIIIKGLRDSTSEDRAIDKYWWYIQVKNMIDEDLQTPINLYLYGSKKDVATGEYLSLLKDKCGIKDTKEIEPIRIIDSSGNSLIINATDIRNIIKKPKVERTSNENRYLDAVLPLDIRELF